MQTTQQRKKRKALCGWFLAGSILFLCVAYKMSESRTADWSGGAHDTGRIAWDRDTGEGYPIYQPNRGYVEHKETQLVGKIFVLVGWIAVIGFGLGVISD